MVGPGNWECNLDLVDRKVVFSSVFHNTGIRKIEPLTQTVTSDWPGKSGGGTQGDSTTILSPW